MFNRLNFETLAAAQTREIETASGISSLGINFKGFIFQLITFLIVFLILRRYVFPKLVATLEKRRETLEQSLIQAKLTEEALTLAEEKAGQILHRAREQADATLAEAKVQAKDFITRAENNAHDRASKIIDESEAQLDLERAKLRSQLKTELADLVTQTTEKVLSTKLTSREDRRLIEQSIKELV